MKRTIPVLLFILLLAISSLACSMPTRQDPTSTPIPPQTPDPQQFEDQLATAEALAKSTGQVQLTFSEEQITSYVASKLSEQSETHFTDPKITLQDGQMTMTGKVQMSVLSGQARIVLEPYLQDGKPYVTIKSATLGSIPFPDSALLQITDIVNANMSEFTTIKGQSILIETLVIENGTMTLTGQAR